MSNNPNVKIVFALATKNQDKIRALKKVLEDDAGKQADDTEIWTPDDFSDKPEISSEVPDNPHDENIYVGARKRAENFEKYLNENCQEPNTLIAAYIGMETGIKKKIVEGKTNYYVITVGFIKTPHHNYICESFREQIPDEMVEGVPHKTSDEVQEWITNKCGKKIDMFQYITDGKKSRYDSFINLLENLFEQISTDYCPWLA